MNDHDAPPARTAPPAPGRVAGPQRPAPVPADAVDAIEADAAIGRLRSLVGELYVRGVADDLAERLRMELARFPVTRRAGVRP